MSTNINPPHFPETGWIEELANRFFKDFSEKLPHPQDAEAPPSRYDPLLQAGNREVKVEPSLEASPHFTPPLEKPSVAGAGISPGGFQQLSAIDLRGAEAPNGHHHYTNSLQEQPSVAGSGISPSAVKQYNEVDVSNPQTSFPDPHFKDTGGVPRILNGQEPAANGQLPHFPAGFPEPSYYFLKENSPGFLQQVAPIVKPDAAPFRDVSTGFDAAAVKKDFPILQELVNGRPLIWLDNAATTQKPQQVIDRLSYFYAHENSNIHRAAHELAARATEAYEKAREKVRSFLNAASVNEIVFVRGTTEAINLVAKTYGEHFLEPGHEIIISHLEHHANIVPWQQLALKKGLKLKVIPVDETGQIILSEYKKLLTSKTKIVAFTQVSNALGTVTPAKEIIDLAHSAGAKVLLDGAQSVSHLKVDLQQLNPDFFVFSGHKIFGPTGIGVLYGKEELLNAMHPWQGGGNMIKDVTFEHTEFHYAPSRFEAGTGNIADAVGLGAALDYVTKIGMDNICRYESFLLDYATPRMREVPGLRIVGTALHKASVLSFTLQGYKNEEVGRVLNQEGIAVRTGHHCAQPILRRFHLENTVRPSLAFYNTPADVDVLVSVLHRLADR
ncbi:family 2A encapsulin nanocompartment cargo protein cysteine desulfurase [Paraflavisolibacter sp. H34]|uniref:family 2A encapsulin nanocompartment cargo protein cysteine desulfurase n=1 Tax=Huijunlia imazamoxiresistens TaxID=3127457 RepID=UPI003018F724